MLRFFSDLDLLFYFVLGFLVINVLVSALFCWVFIVVVVVVSLGFFNRCWFLRVCVCACAHILGNIFLIFLIVLSEWSKTGVVVEE